MFACERCRQSLDVAASAAPPGDSYLVLPQPRQLERARTLPSLPRAEPLVAATHAHEQLLTAGRLLELAERAKPVECGVPLCDECLANVHDELHRRLDEAYAEKQQLQAAFAELEVGEEDSLEAIASDELFAARVEAQEEEATQLRLELEAAQRERDELDEQLQRLQQQRAEQEAQGEAQYAALNAAELERQERHEEAVRTAQLVAYCERELQRLERIEILDDLFRISTNGPIGTINALRLGRLHGVSVDWPEVNAALGQVVLLLHTLAQLHQYEFQLHRLVPMGSFSKVYRVDEPRTVYELHSSGVAQLNRFLGGGRFDTGLGMMLTCTRELINFASRRPRAGMSAQPPYTIDKDLIGGYSVRLVNQSEEKWTQAFKCLLADLKWLVAWHGAS